MQSITDIAARQRELFTLSNGTFESDEEANAIQFEEFALIQELADLPARTLADLGAKAEVLHREFRPDDGNAECIDALMLSVIADALRLCQPAMASPSSEGGKEKQTIAALAATYTTAFDKATALVKAGTDEGPEFDALDAERDRSLEALVHLPARTAEDLQAKAAVAAREDVHGPAWEPAIALRHSIWRDIAALGH